jgi:hypothetical protein
MLRLLEVMGREFLANMLGKPKAVDRDAAISIVFSALVFAAVHTIDAWATQATLALAFLLLPVMWAYSLAAAASAFLYSRGSQNPARVRWLSGLALLFTGTILALVCYVTVTIVTGPSI